MSEVKPKTKTASGKEISRFTMKVQFKPECIIPHPTTGEMRKFWTYRQDLEVEKKKRKGIVLEKEFDVFGLILLEMGDNFKTVEIFDNALPPGEQTRLYLLNGNIRFPISPSKVKAVKAWLNGLNKGIALL